MSLLGYIGALGLRSLLPVADIREPQMGGLLVPEHLRELLLRPSTGIPVRWVIFAHPDVGERLLAYYKTEYEVANET